MSDAEIEVLAERFNLSITEIHPLAVLPVLREKKPLLPAKLIAAVERWMTGNSWLASLANSRIYVLQHQKPKEAQNANAP